MLLCGLTSCLRESAGIRRPWLWDWSRKVAAYFEQHCVDCHGPEKQKGDFRIDTLSPKVGFENTPQWLEVMARINSGEMPPKKVKMRPAAEESARGGGMAVGADEGGRGGPHGGAAAVSYNRLTREEYVNTVRDLLGVQFDATDPAAFLEDPEWHGFERIGSVLTLSPSNVEKYLSRGGDDPGRGLPGQEAAAPVDVDQPRCRCRESDRRAASRAACEARGCWTRCATRCGRATSTATPRCGRAAAGAGHLRDQLSSSAA